MSYNFSLNYGYLVQHGVYNRSGETNPTAQLLTPNYSENIEVTLYPRWYKHIAVEWKIPADWGPCLFNVYFSQTESEGFVKLNAAPIDNTYLLDTETQEYMKFNRGFYIVEAILKNKGNVSISSGPATWGTHQTRWVEMRSNEIQRREFVLLTKFAGIKSYVFRKRTYGERCPECWNHTSEKAIKDHCSTCIGTTFKGGYFPPAPAFFQYEATQNSLSKTYFGKFEQDQSGAWTIAWPEVRPDDVIVRVGDWNLYRVERRAATELQGQVVRQMLQLTQLSKNDVEYSLVTKGLPEFPKKYL